MFTELMWLIAELLLQILAVIFLPTAFIKFIYKDLDFVTAMVASLWIVFMPAVFGLNTMWDIDSFYRTFVGWGVQGLITYNWSSWAFTAGAVVSCIYAAVLLCCGKGKNLGITIIGFLWFSLFLYGVGLILIPFILFGNFGWQLARDNQAVLLVTLILTCASTIYIGFSDSCKKIFKSRLALVIR